MSRRAAAAASAASAPAGEGRYRAVLHLHTERSDRWQYPPLRRFGVPDCYVSLADRVREHAGRVEGLFVTDHDVPFVLDEPGYSNLQEALAAAGAALDVASGEEVSVPLPPVAGGPARRGLEVLVLYRGLHPYHDRARILAAHTEVHRHVGDVAGLFRFLRTRDDLVDIVAHPFAGLLRLDAATLYRLLEEGLIVRVEAFSGGETTLRQNWYAHQVARVWGLGMTASDDAHVRTRGPRNWTWAAGPALADLLSALDRRETGITTVHAPVWPRKVAEVVRAFYGGYLPWAMRRLGRHRAADAPGLFAQRLAVSAFGVAACAPVTLPQAAIYLARGEHLSARLFADLARLDRRLDSGAAAFHAWRRHVCGV